MSPIRLFYFFFTFFATTLPSLLCSEPGVFQVAEAIILHRINGGSLKGLMGSSPYPQAIQQLLDQHAVNVRDIPQFEKEQRIIEGTRYTWTEYQNILRGRYQKIMDDAGTKILSTLVDERIENLNIESYSNIHTNLFKGISLRATRDHYSKNDFLTWLSLYMSSNNLRVYEILGLSKTQWELKQTKLDDAITPPPWEAKLIREGRFETFEEPAGLKILKAISNEGFNNLDLTSLPSVNLTQFSKLSVRATSKKYSLTEFLTWLHEYRISNDLSDNDLLGMSIDEWKKRRNSLLNDRVYTPWELEVKEKGMVDRIDDDIGMKILTRMFEEGFNNFDFENLSLAHSKEFISIGKRACGKFIIKTDFVNWLTRYKNFHKVSIEDIFYRLVRVTEGPVRFESWRSQQFEARCRELKTVQNREGRFEVCKTSIVDTEGLKILNRMYREGFNRFSFSNIEAKHAYAFQTLSKRALGFSVSLNGFQEWFDLYNAKNSIAVYDVFGRSKAEWSRMKAGVPFDLTYSGRELLNIRFQRYETVNDGLGLSILHHLYWTGFHELDLSTLYKADLRSFHRLAKNATGRLVSRLEFVVWLSVYKSIHNLQDHELFGVSKEDWSRIKEKAESVQDLSVVTDWDSYSEKFVRQISVSKLDAYSSVDDEDFHESLKLDISHAAHHSDDPLLADLVETILSDSSIDLEDRNVVVNVQGNIFDYNGIRRLLSKLKSNPDLIERCSDMFEK